MSSSATGMATATAATSEASIESRLSAVEAKIGLLPVPNDKANNSVADRLASLKSSFEAKTTTQLRTSILESDKLMKDLDPGMALTHQQQPLLYRRQEVLASSDSLRNDMEELRKILHLLLTSSSSSGSLREDAVTQAPILTSTNITHDDQRRLDALRLRMEGFQTRTQDMVAKVDHLVQTYHGLISAASEKFVIADEAIRMRE